MIRTVPCSASRVATPCSTKPPEPVQRSILVRIWTAFYGALKRVVEAIASVFCCSRRAVRKKPIVLSSILPPGASHRLGAFNGSLSVGVGRGSVEACSLKLAIALRRAVNARMNFSYGDQGRALVDNSVRIGNALQGCSSEDMSQIPNVLHKDLDLAQSLRDRLDLYLQDPNSVGMFPVGRGHHLVLSDRSNPSAIRWYYCGVVPGKPARFLVMESPDDVAQTLERVEQEARDQLKVFLICYVQPALT